MAINHRKPYNGIVLLKVFTLYIVECNCQITKMQDNMLRIYDETANNQKLVVLNNNQIYSRGYTGFHHFRPDKDYIPGTQKLYRFAVPAILPFHADSELATALLEANHIDVAITRTTFAPPRSF
ncbi:hypothetical protein Zmor_027570 [Zophobas morio]|uniref:Uncharacterized protein n=1 Tax=Zophobas morio TaxID=2755281 RepID=A0AA38HNK3_9CUCU|nr:hypothetical protein Zmor_027570 [Zophobas morio]